jgi:hypothetical protein
VDIEVREQRAQHEEGGPVEGEDDQATDGQPPQAAHGLSVARTRVTLPHPLRVTTSHPSAA